MAPPRSFIYTSTLAIDGGFGPEAKGPLAVGTLARCITATGDSRLPAEIRTMGLNGCMVKWRRTMTRAQIAPKHAAYRRDLGLRDYLGGPFADRSGGLITFQADSGVEAERLVANDPFLAEDLLERHWVKEWLTD